MERAIFPKPFLISYSSTVREEVTYSHGMFSILQRVFFQFRQDLLSLIHPSRLRHKEKKHNVKIMQDVQWKTVVGNLSKLPTVSLPLQTTASTLLDKQPSVLSISVALAAWPVWFDGCCPVTPHSSQGPSGSGTSRGGLSLRTVILMQLPAFLRALTASWWVTPCMSRPLTWKERKVHGHVRHVVPLKLWEQRSEVRELHVFPENSMSFLCKTDFSKQSWPVWWVDVFSVCSLVCVCVCQQSNFPFWE